jgi:ABC-2 type transport system ATP-binding protein
VDGLGFDAGRAAVTAVVGPNGAGKTTTIEICEGFRTADAGQVRVLGRDPQVDAAALKARVGVMLQSGGVYGAITPKAALAHAASLYASPQRPDVLLSQLGLQSSARTPYRRLSGGQQQRLGIALAVIGRPELVFLDEPTAGLDPQARHATWNLIADLRQAGVSVVLTTHYLEEAEQLADHVVIVDAGAVVASGTPAALTTAAQGDVIRMSAAPRLDMSALQKSLPPRATALEEAPGSYRVAGAETAAMLASLMAWCTANSIEPTSVVTERRKLQDVFLELTGKELRP